MTVFTYSQARQNFARLLDTAVKEDVLIRRRDGSAFFVKLADIVKGSPLSVRGIKKPIGRDNIVRMVREGRRYS